MNSNDIKGLLSLRYAPPAYAFFTEVGNGTGANGSGYADAIAVALFPSMGLKLDGFEIKSIRSDWLKELNHPEKSYDFVRHSDRWWIVAPKGVVNIDEVPKNWGYMELIGEKFYIKKRAPELDAVFDKEFAVSLLRRATEGTVQRSTLWKLQEKARDDAKIGYQKEIDDANEKYEKLRKKVRAFEELAGFPIDGWSESVSVDAGKAVRFVLDGGFKSTDWRVDGAIDDLKSIIERLEQYKALMAAQPATLVSK